MQKEIETSNFSNASVFVHQSVHPFFRTKGYRLCLSEST